VCKKQKTLLKGNKTKDWMAGWVSVAHFGSAPATQPALIEQQSPLKATENPPIGN
jgi:hypothetical protein